MPNIKYKDKFINYEIKKTKPKKSISIKIKYPDIVQVYAPSSFDEKELNKLVLSKGNWILNKLEELKNRKAESISLEFADGSFLPFIGLNYPLKIIKSNSIITCKLEFDNKYFIAYIPTFMKSSSIEVELKKLFIEFLIHSGYKVISERIDIYSNILRVSPKSFKVKEQKNSWGTCSSLGNIYINYKILLAPIDIIDYVIVHELCHLIEMNHSNKFWSLVENIIPDYKCKKEWLKINGIKLNI